MKKIILKSLKLKNFKGIKELSIDLSERTNIYGNNGTGKTTIFDAFSWLLFDKDSQGSSKFEVKTIGHNSKVLHGLDHEVGAIILSGSETITLKKLYKEKWTKQRGSANKSFTGHTTDYFVNEVPMKKKEYLEKINDIVDEETFKLLTNPMHFNSLEWKKKRDIIIEIAGDITDEEVINSNKDLKGLLVVLGSHDIDEHMKIISAKKKLLNKNLDAIPHRMDEVNNSIVELERDSKEDLENEIQDLRGKKELQEEELKDIDNGSNVAEKKLKISELEKEKIEFENKNSKDSLAEIKVLRDKKEKLSSEGSEEKINLNNIKNLLETRKKELQEMNDKTTDLRSNWYDLNKTKYEGEDTCPTCKQILPHSEIEKALDNFNINKSKKLEKIKTDGIKLKETVTAIQESIKGLEEGKETSTNKCKGFADEIGKITLSILDIEEKINLFKEHKAYKAICEKIQDIQEELEFSSSKTDESKKEIKEKIVAIEKSIQDQQRDFLKIENNEKLKLRINELEKEQENLAAQYEDLEKETFLSEEFIKTKVRMLEEKINEKFEFARFKMFEEQVNGGISECCETLYKNIPYNNNLNNGARINVGLDIINTLSKHFECIAPIFIDNKESVTKLIELEAQTINLIVSEQDKTLRIEN